MHGKYLVPGSPLFLSCVLSYRIQRGLASLIRMSFWGLQMAFRAQNPPRNRRIRPWGRLRDTPRRSSGRPIRISRPKGGAPGGVIRAGGSTVPSGGHWPPAPPEPPSGQTRRAHGCVRGPGRAVPDDEWRTPPPDAGAAP